MAFEVLNGPTGFEGCEKKLEIDFSKNNDLRKITRASWDAVLTDARCTIIGETKNQHFDSYILSESSLFVFPHKVIIKTCGTTRLLHCLPKLLKATKDIGVVPEFVQYSRANFIFPKEQPFPHRSFDLEVNILNTFFLTGQAFVLGPMNGPRWHLYIADLHSKDYDRTNDKEQTLEILMFGLDPAIMRQFYNRLGCDEPNDEKNQDLASTGDEATKLAGIDKLIPGSYVDAFLFKPCGYSCNALKDSTYFTIHITPESHCSFVSFETNLPVQNYDELVQRVLKTFKPGYFCMSVFVDKFSLASSAQKSSSWEYDGFSSAWHSMQNFGSYNVSCAHFLSDQWDMERKAAMIKSNSSKPKQSSKKRKVTNSSSDNNIDNKQPLSPSSGTSSGTSSDDDEMPSSRDCVFDHLDLENLDMEELIRSHMTVTIPEKVHNSSSSSSSPSPSPSSNDESAAVFD